MSTTDEHRPTIVSHSSRVQVLVTSFGYLHLHDDPPPAAVLVDVREHLRDPHTDPAFRVLTATLCEEDRVSVG